MDFARMRITPAARKHRIGSARMRYVVEHPFVVLVQPPAGKHADERWLYLGDDATGLALEVGGIALDRDLLVVHAQPIYQRGRFVAAYEFGRELQRWVT